MFLQVHALTSYHASLLNRDDAGLAKRIRFGGVERLRISSQCLKRHWREWMLGHCKLPSGIRTRHFFARVIKQSLIDQGMDEATAHSLTFHLAKNVLLTAGEKDAVNKDTLMMNQPVLFGRPEAEYFIRLIQEAASGRTLAEAISYLEEKVRAAKSNFRSMLRQAGLSDLAGGFEGAMFGRFVTSDILTRVDAPVHVAHAFTTHALDTEVDFFTVVDDLSRDEETGAAHANDMELGAGIFYIYVVVDVPLLIQNLTGCARAEWKEQDTSDARELLTLLVQAITQVTPGAKLGATAPYARSECVILEAGTSQPRSLANAFLKPVRLGLYGEHPMAQSIKALAEYLGALERMYGQDTTRRWVASLHPWPRPDEPTVSLAEAIEGALTFALGGQYGSADLTA